LKYFHEIWHSDIGLPEVHLTTSMTSTKILDGNKPLFWKPFLRTRTKFCTCLAEVWVPFSYYSATMSQRICWSFSNEVRVSTAMISGHQWSVVTITTYQWQESEWVGFNGTSTQFRSLARSLTRKTDTESPTVKESQCYMNLANAILCMDLASVTTEQYCM